MDCRIQLGRPALSRSTPCSATRRSSRPACSRSRNRPTGLLALVKLKSVYRWPLAAGQGRPGEISISHYWNEYPPFDDTNNLSLVTFVHGPEYSVIFPGDLERAGWRTLLTNADFRRELSRVGVFIASHHGRENGYCEAVFDYCRPQIVIISDEPMAYDTQEDCYAQHASGISWNGGRETRRVLTTRCDGDIRIGPPSKIR